MGLIFNNREIWEGDSGILYKIPSGYNGFFVSAQYGTAPDIGNYKAVSGSDTLTLLKSINDCDNGIIINLSSEVISWITDNSYPNEAFTPKGQVSPLKMIIKKSSPHASMRYGAYPDSDTTFPGNVVVSGNKIKFTTTDGIPGTGYLTHENVVIFWAIKSIVEY